MAAITLRERALAALARREYARAELARKLAEYSDDAEQLQALLDDLEQRDWLSDARYVEQLLHARQARDGSYKILTSLRQQGIAEPLIKMAQQQLQTSEFARAQRVWQKKFACPPTDARERAQQMRFMLSRGFDLAVINRLFTTGTDE